ncbi:glycosyltransferase family 2 protein [Bosea sp. NBC_00550]|uniref:glycosyltransferase family 2 protein n=1 Tax=Bosea sp. NBC_00550 TaxID=2969621 RepID=UPI0022326CA4|nr:glycosyltransferase family 2 protein [Bosea sp. NBC_00550]UZF94454.1 glycosyltransferase family 2 protein [Bosea sp. NBC_00550]
MAALIGTSSGPALAEDRPHRSLVIPVYRNEENIDDLIPVLAKFAREPGDIEIVFVIDGSPDRSGEILRDRLDEIGCPATIVFHSRNFGSFTAIRTGIEIAGGDFVAVMAADLQEPPELIREFFDLLESGEVDIAFGKRSGRHDSPIQNALSNAFWWLYRKMVIRDIPKGGVDIFACNRAVMNSLLEISEPNSSLVAQLFWVGYRRVFVPYERRPRMKGASAWNFSRRLRYMMDSIFSFSDVPILAVLWIGIAGCLLSLCFAIFVMFARLFGLITEPGYTGLTLLIVFMGSSTLAVQGVIGSYLWRTFENTKRRPLRVISKIERIDPRSLGFATRVEKPHEP